MGDVVISYKKEEKARVEAIAEKLRALRLLTWFDESIPAGVTYDEAINAELQKANCILVCWTPAALESSFVRAEAMIGYNRGILASCVLEPTPVLEQTAPFSLIQFADLSGWRGEDTHPQWRKLIERIAQLAGRPGLPAYLDIVAAKGVSPDLAAWKKQYPNDPLAQEAWSEARARLQRADAFAKKKQRGKKLGKSGNAVVPILAIAIALVGAVTAYLFLNRSSPAMQTPSSWIKVAAPYEYSDLAYMPKQAAQAARSNKDGATTAAEQAASEADRAHTLLDGPDGVNAQVTTLNADASEAICLDTLIPLATAKSIQGDGPQSTVIICDDRTAAGLLDLATGSGSLRMQYPSQIGGTTVTITYSGDVRSFRSHGLGVMSPSVDGVWWSYSGQFEAGLPEGTGVFTLPDGGRYEGSVSESKYDGAGILWRNSGNEAQPGCFRKDEWNACNGSE